MPVGEPENFRDGLCTARESHRIGRICGEPFVTGVPLKRALVGAKRPLRQATCQLIKLLAADGCHSTG